MHAIAEIQQWLGAMIAQPLQKDHLLSQLSPFGNTNEQESAKFIAQGAASLQPYERIQIYHQQYWWRLLKGLHTNFPTLIRLFGSETFQIKIGVPYLCACPPSHWALCCLGETLPAWLEKNYREEDRYLVIQAARIDWAVGHTFYAGNFPSVNFADLSAKEILNKMLVLQPYIHLFALEGDFFAFREEFLKNAPEYYNVNPFPEMTYGDYYFVLYRTPANVVTWNTLSYPEFWVLSQFERGSTVDKVCADLEEEGGKNLEEALLHIPLWFKQWTVLKWFGSSSSSL